MKFPEFFLRDSELRNFWPDNRVINSYELCDKNFIQTEAFNVLPKKIEDLKFCNDTIFYSYKDAKHQKFMLKLTGIDCRIYTKKQSNLMYRNYLHQKHYINEYTNTSDRLDSTMKEINELHHSINVMFDCASKEHATEYAKKESYKIYCLMKQRAFLEEEKITFRKAISFRQNHTTYSNYNRPLFVTEDKYEI